MARCHLRGDAVSQQLNRSDDVVQIRDGNQAADDSPTEDVEHDFFFASVDGKSFVYRLRLVSLPRKFGCRIQLCTTVLAVQFDLLHPALRRVCCQQSSGQQRGMPAASHQILNETRRGDRRLVAC